MSVAFQWTIVHCLLKEMEPESQYELERDTMALVKGE